MPDGLGRIAAVVIALLATGCDPVLNVFGSFFPAWVICMVIGITLAIAARSLLAIAGLEPHLGPLLLVYPCLGLLLTMATWLVFFHP
jgi:hypothetical protein